MAIYKVRKNSAEGSARFLITAKIVDGFTPSTVKEKAFTFPLDSEQYTAVCFTMSAAEVFNYFDAGKANVILDNPYNFTPTDFVPVEQEPDDWETLGRTGVKYWKYDSINDRYDRTSGNFTTDIYSVYDDRFSQLVFFENGVNFGVFHNSTIENCVPNAWEGAFHQLGQLRFGENDLTTYLDQLHARAYYGSSSVNTVNGYGGDVFLCEYTYNDTPYLGVIIMGVDGTRTNSGAAFVGAPQKIFGEFAKPEFQDENEQQGGLRGTYDKTSAGVGFPDGSAISSIMSSFVAGDGAGYHIYSLPAGGLTAFVSGFYNPSMFTTLQNVTYNVTDCIVNAQILPVAVPTDNGAHPIHAAGVTIGTAVAAAVSQTVVNVDCGAVDLSGLYFDTYLDYGDYTTIKLFLPFVGFVDIPSNKCMGGSLHLYANVDVITGNILYGVIATDRHGITELINQSDGQCGISVPLVSSMKNIGGVAGATIGGIAAVATMNPIAIGYAAVNAASLKNSETGLLTKFSGSAGSMGCMQPYVLISRPCPSIPKDGSASYLGMWGTTSEIMTTVSQCSGYLRAHSVRMDAVEDATAEEKEEIRRLLNDGIFV